MTHMEYEYDMSMRMSQRQQRAAHVVVDEERPGRRRPDRIGRSGGVGGGNSGRSAGDGGSGGGQVVSEGRDEKLERSASCTGMRQLESK